MANPTTNYGWQMPTPTDLVTDLPADFGVFGQAVDSTVFANAAAALSATIVDAKGDIIAATAADAVSRLAVGANATVLTADSAEATGLKWAAAGAGGSLTELATGTLSGASVNVTGLSGSYKALKIIVINWRPTPDGNNLEVRFNNDANARYKSITPSLGSAAETFSDTEMFLMGYAADNTVTTNFGMMDVWNYANTTHWKMAQLYYANADFTTNTSVRMGASVAAYNQTTAITAITFWGDGGTFAAGTYFIYGVN